MPLKQRSRKDQKRNSFIKVVIADENTLLREGLKRIFSAESDLLVVGEAADEVEVAEVVERTKPDVLLLDLEIPKRGAVPILLELNQKNIAAKVLILSLFPEEEGILDTAKAGACGYALKRTSAATLIQAIRRIHRGEISANSQLNCAKTFVELARRTQTYDANEQEKKIAKLLSKLSKRELEILGLVAKGLTNEEIRTTLFVSQRTVKVHLNHVFHKLGVNNRTKAALLFVQHESTQEPGLENKKTEQLAGKRTGIKLYQRGKNPSHRVPTEAPRKTKLDR